MKKIFLVPLLLIALSACSLSKEVPSSPTENKNIMSGGYQDVTTSNNAPVPNSGDRN